MQQQNAGVDGKVGAGHAAMLAAAGNIDGDFDSGIDKRDQNRDDKLTQSQLLKRMLEADERDNRRERQREEHAESRDRFDRDRLNEACMMIPGTPESRGRRGGAGPPGAGEEGDAADD